MKIQEYLQTKYKVQIAQTMLKSEAKIFGVPYPLRYGWFKRLEGLELTETMRERLILSLSTGVKDSRFAGLEALGVDHTTLEMREKVIHVPNPPGSNLKRSKARERKNARKQAQKAQRGVVTQVIHPAYKTPVPSRMPHVPMPPPSGVDPRSTEFLMTYEWRRVRMMALKKYGTVCQCCGAGREQGAVINVDHIKPRKFFPQLALDLSNLQVLCGECNEGKGNWDMTDWRLPEEQRNHLRSI